MPKRWLAVSAAALKTSPEILAALCRRIPVLAVLLIGLVKRSLRERLNPADRRVGYTMAGAALTLLAILAAATANVETTTVPTSRVPAVPEPALPQRQPQQHTRQIAEELPRQGTILTYGQDVSNHQPDHDWEASPAQFGIVKATEGLTFRDHAFARHWQELDRKGIVRGAYHYGHPRNDPIAEAEHFLSVVNSQPGKPGDLLVLDLETADGKSVAEVNAWAKAWLGHVKARTGITPMFYSSWSFADTYGEGLSEYPLWVAHYSRPKGQVDPPADWKTWVIHQYSDEPIDHNVSALTPDQLRALGRPAA